MTGEHGCGQDVAAYALGALPDADAERFRRHLETCELCRADLHGLRPVVDALPDSAERVEPPPELRRSIMAVVEREAAQARAAARPRRSWSWSWALLRPQPAFAAACVLLLAGLGVGLALSTGEEARTLNGKVAIAGASAKLHTDDGRATLEVEDMPAPETGRVMQVWLVRGKGAPEPTDALFTPNRKGTAHVSVPGDLDGVTQVLVSEEPQGGSTSPSTVPSIRFDT